MPDVTSPRNRTAAPTAEPRNKQLPAWLTLLRAPGLRNAPLRRLVHEFGTPQALLDALSGAPTDCGLAPQTLDYLAAPDEAALQRDMEWLAHPHHHAITLNDPRYPPLLRDVPGAPPVLFVRGRPELLSSLQIAIVGSRNPTAHGRELAQRFAAELARRQITVTSGLALGIDAAAHRGALVVQGATLAVAGTGLDSVYPRCHAELAQRIVADGGALVSEFVPGTPARPGHFPQRNSVISGLSLGVLVVEAALRSGSLITARLAAEQGREVFAIPGSIDSPLSRGCHRLLRLGAKLVEKVEDMLEELVPLAAAAVTPCSAPLAREAAQPDSGQQRLLELMGYDPVSVDVLVERSGLTPERVSAMILVLELHGLVTKNPGGQYVRINLRA